ncbi:hypothetical protein K435DRAFT_849467 [Dendrothele bispora CBS 962.96]|uniref:Uncharacterized protein n=1 Tax=Dendrothele bispora (strain CBS 962.96) TaxID=1314807 RepID=A0A4S8MSR0_DENBC|nr:hypothetical protein K435DRAFT_849467 [Dendrothele bispora CBS 962.96]
MSALPSVLYSQPAAQDVTTTHAVFDVAKSLAKVTSPEETALFICALQSVSFARILFQVPKVPHFRRLLSSLSNS